MDKLDKELHRMSKIEPSKAFIKASKNRLMQQIVLQQKESWFQNFLRSIGVIQVPGSFVTQVRLRLMSRINSLPQPIRIPLHGFSLFLNYTKKAVASTLVMLIAVTSTLFFVEGSTVVEASDESYLEIIKGSASIKHPDLIVWEDINGLIEIQAGDLIKVEQNSEVIIRFFDDTELRLSENSMLLITHLAVSPNFGRQAVIEASLHVGKAWVQTLNVEDGYAGFTLSTRDAVMKTLNGTFNVETKLNTPTTVYNISNKLELISLMAETRQMVENTKLSAKQKATIHVGNGNPIITVEAISEQDMATDWRQNNLQLDSKHLTELREKGIERLTQMAGTLPGQMLYPIKQTKERLKLAFGGDSDVDYQIEIANRRLNEAMVLFEAGEQQKGREALLAYQSLAREIAATKGSQKLENRLITPHKKVLTADLPNDASAGLVKEALHQAAEIFAGDDPVELEKIRLANSVQRLLDVNMLVTEGNIEAAKERLVSHQLASGDALATAEAIEDEALKKEVLQDVLELRQEELSLLASLSNQLSDEDDAQRSELAAMVDSASKASKENVEITLAAIIPFMPEIIQQKPEKPTAADIKLKELIDKIYIYKTWQGQQNQIERLLKNELQNTSSIAYLMTVRDQLEGNAQEHLNTRILQLQKKAEIQKGKAVQRKIDRAIRLREVQ